MINTVHFKTFILFLLAIAMLFSVNQSQAYYVYTLVPAFCLLAVAAIILFSQKIVKIPFNLSVLFLTLFYCWAIISTLLSKVTFDPVLGFYLLFSFILAFFSASFLCRERKALFLLFILIGLLGMFIAADLIYHAISFHVRTVFFDNKNILAAFLNMIFLAACAYFLMPLSKCSPWQKRGINFFCATTIFVLSIALFLIESKGAASALFIALIGFFIFVFKTVKKRELIFLFLIMAFSFFCTTILMKHYHVPIISVGTLAPIEQTEKQRAPVTIKQPPLADKNSYTQWNKRFNTAFSERKIIWGSAIQLRHDMPWHGFGLGTYKFVYPKVGSAKDNSTRLYAHNDYLQFLIELGFPGLFLWLLFLGSVAYLFVRFLFQTNDPDDRCEASGLFCALLAVSLHSIVTFNFYITAVLILLGIYYARLTILFDPSKNNFQLNKKFHFFLRLGVVLFLILCLMLFLSRWFSQKGDEALAQKNYLGAAQSYQQSSRVYSSVESAIGEGSIYLFLADYFKSSSKDKQAIYYEKALNKAQKAIAMNPYRSVSYDFLAAVYQAEITQDSEKHFQQVTDVYEKGLKLNHYDQHLRYDYAVFLVENQQYEKAKQLLYSGLAYGFIDFDAQNILIPYVNELSRLAIMTHDHTLQKTLTSIKIKSNVLKRDTLVL